MEHLDPIDPESIENFGRSNAMPPPGGQNTRSVSVFGQNGNMDDFPVLKAFQEYIDAEQAKARKRMVGLSIFFVSLLFLVIVGFVFMMLHMNSRNQQLSDRLFDMAFNKSNHQPLVTVQQPRVEPSASELKPVLEKMESLVKAVSERQQTVQTPIVVTAPHAAPVATVPQTSAENKEALELKKELAELKKEMAKEKARLAAEKKEAERQKKVEEHRRRLYPEYYAAQDMKKKGGDRNSLVREKGSNEASVPQVRPITSTPPSMQKPVRQVSPPVSVPPAVQKKEDVPQVVRPITSTPPEMKKPVKDSGDKDLQDLMKTVSPQNDKQKTESLEVGEGVQMLLPAL